MKPELQKILMVVGAVALVYLFIRYLLPVVLGLLGLALSVVVTVLLWVLVAAAVILALAFLLSLFRK